MKEVSFTPFLDFLTKSGTAKITVVRNFLQGEYDPAHDFYKAVREAIISIERNEISPKNLMTEVGLIGDEKKIIAYNEISNGYKTWRGRKKVTWFTPPRKKAKLGELIIVVNPELGLTIGDEPHLIKLYFKQEKLSLLKVSSALQLLSSTCEAHCPKGTKMSILDIRNSKLHVLSKPKPDVDILLQAEASHWLTVSKSVTKLK